MTSIHDLYHIQPPGVGEGPCVCLELHHLFLSTKSSPVPAVDSDIMTALPRPPPAPRSVAMSSCRAEWTVLWTC